MHPRRGEVWWVSFDPSVGGEIRKTRPAIVLSNNAANTALNRVIVVPLTSQTERLYPGEAMVMLNGEQSKAKADQIATASKQRLRSKAGSLSSADLAAVEKAVLLQLGIRRYAAQFTLTAPGPARTLPPPATIVPRPWRAPADGTRIPPPSGFPSNS